MSPRPAVRVAVVCPSRPLTPERIEAVRALAAPYIASGRLDLVFHPQCLEVHNHFAGPDAHRLEALVSVANDPNFDAVWFGRGGYGAGRIAEAAIARLNDHARNKQYLGFSDAGFLLAGLYRTRFPHLAHGPMPGDIAREGGATAVERALEFLAGGDTGLEPTTVEATAPLAAFNLTVLCHLLGTKLVPDLSGHVLYLEDVGEYHYRLDRAFCQILSQSWAPSLAGIRLGRCTPIPVDEADTPFGETEVEIAKLWCAKTGIPYFGRADIGHDIQNKIVMFGRS
ncbi:MAG: LD-carboxypeptidase [Caulobacterales bacterium]